MEIFLDAAKGKFTDIDTGEAIEETDDMPLYQRFKDATTREALTYGLPKKGKD